VTVQTACPEPARLKGLLDGTLPPADGEALTTHLEACVRCQQALEGLAADGESWAALRRHLTRQEPPVEPALARVMAGITGHTGSADTVAEPRPAGDLPADFLEPSDDPRHLGRLGPYEVLGVIGRGGMGVVFQVIDSNLERVVALKVMAPQLAAQESARKRFLREARAAAAVWHEHVVPIHAVDEARGLP
jgi:serine/threonine-protein kinase